jgi:hypothetical protein
MSHLAYKCEDPRTRATVPVPRSFATLNSKHPRMLAFRISKYASSVFRAPANAEKPCLPACSRWKDRGRVLADAESKHPPEEEQASSSASKRPWSFQHQRVLESRAYPFIVNGKTEDASLLMRKASILGCFETKVAIDLGTGTVARVLGSSYLYARFDAHTGIHIYYCLKKKNMHMILCARARRVPKSVLNSRQPSLYFSRSLALPRSMGQFQGKSHWNHHI